MRRPLNHFSLASAGEPPVGLWIQGPSPSLKGIWAGRAGAPPPCLSWQGGGSRWVLCFGPSPQPLRRRRRRRHGFSWLGVGQWHLDWLSALQNNKPYFPSCLVLVYMLHCICFICTLKMNGLTGARMCRNPEVEPFGILHLCRVSGHVKWWKRTPKFPSLDSTPHFAFSFNHHSTATIFCM